MGAINDQCALRPSGSGKLVAELDTQVMTLRSDELVFMRLNLYESSTQYTIQTALTESGG